MTINPATNGGVRLWVAPEPKYPARRAMLVNILGGLVIYFAAVVGLAALGVPILAAAGIGLVAQLVVSVAYNKRVARKHRRAWDAWFDSEAERRAAERLARFDAHVARLGITEKGAP